MDGYWTRFQATATVTWHRFLVASSDTAAEADLKKVHRCFLEKMEEYELKLNK